MIHQPEEYLRNELVRATREKPWLAGRLAVMPSLPPFCVHAGADTPTVAVVTANNWVASTHNKWCPDCGGQLEWVLTDPVWHGWWLCHTGQSEWQHDPYTDRPESATTTLSDNNP
jgi:hypothetical protein